MAAPTRTLQWHLVVHACVLGALLLLAAGVGLYVAFGQPFPLRERGLYWLVPYGFALLGAMFGIWRTATYDRDANSGDCELTVLTSEAKTMPYLFYLIACAWAPLVYLIGAIVRWLWC